MIGVITGDVINSRTKSPEVWLEIIKSTLEENKISNSHWDIFRGDMFQIEICAEDILELTIKLKAAVKQEKELDLRMSIGIGSKNYAAQNVLESNGEAYIFSGQGFEELKKKSLIIKTPWEDFDQRWNMIIGLALLTMDNWAPITAKIFKTALDHKDISQKTIAETLTKSQSSISEALSRAGQDEIIEMLRQFKTEIKTTLKPHDTVS